MPGKLTSKVAIVTGATSGMGKAIAELFAKEGARLTLAGRDQKRGEALLEQLRPVNPDIQFVPGDLTQAGANEELVKETVNRFGRLDLLSLNAGVLGLGSVTDLSIEDWHRTLETNLSAIFYLCKFALPEMRKSGGGNILINASIAAFKSFPNHPAYCASKAGAVALMKQMARDYGPEVRVNAICPGPVDTPLLWESAAAFDHPESAVEEARKATLLQKLGEPGDIARLALFLASEDSSWITGSAITIDGGILNA
ncbi:SDR family NAD(P)-dependent oxidoreductase [Robiginitalea sp. SC105]|uniref:SDR family NAD(P)-dependent oxidoreductase n=1 Tax=Robiginitalea sp. SC105 TaxID=2762332 RepID=UPI00163A472F|nr:SDR family oxidoreductase [Robiginitalea sp. SC105]MBC2839821.1 SDR family oxidoreductase [Robiginitalea sp. SC105]